MIAQLRNHTIICGSGLMAKTLIDLLQKQHQPLVLVCNCSADLEYHRRFNPNLPIVQAELESELALSDANVLYAGSVVAVSDSDVSNLMIAITTKSLDPNIRVLCSAQSGDFANRLRKVGVDHVICPAELGGKHLAGVLGESDA